MSKETQIEEMASIIHRNINGANFDDVSDGVCALYNEGYNKQSEGEWKLGKSGCIYFCSSCNYAAHPREVEEWNFCPKCGANMKDPEKQIEESRRGIAYIYHENRWEKTGVGITERLVCSNCKSEKGSFMQPPFCNQCGAKMKGENNG